MNIFDKTDHTTIYNSDNLNFFHIGNHEDNLILYKSKMIADQYDTECIIRNIINKINNDNYSKKLYQSSNIKFLNYDELFEKVNKQNKKITGYDIEFKRNNFESKIYIFDFYTNVNLTLSNITELKFKNNPYKINDDFKYFIGSVFDDIVNNISIIDNTNFETIEEYLNSFDFDLTELPNYKIIRTTIEDLKLFNNCSLNFSEIQEYYDKNRERFQIFLKSIEIFPDTLKFEYYNFKRFKEDNSWKKVFKIHFPLLFLDLSFNFALKNEKDDHHYGNRFEISNLESYIVTGSRRIKYFDSNYCAKNTKTILKIYFYLFNQTSTYNKFIDKFEKNSLNN